MERSRDFFVRHRSLPKNSCWHYESDAQPFQVAVQLDCDAALVWVDDRFEYGESRMIALAPETAVLCYVAFVDRGKLRRVIRLRRANRREVKHYVENF